MPIHLNGTPSPHGQACTSFIRMILRTVLQRRARNGVLLAAIFLLVPSPSAFAHAELVDSSPVAGSTVSQTPSVITLRFTEPIDPDAVRVSLVLPGGALVETHLMITGDIVELHPYRPLAAGEHVISWKVVSADGHLVSGLIPFRVGSVGSVVGVDGENWSSGALPNSTYTSTYPVGNVGHSPLDRAAEALSWILVAAILAACLASRRRLVIVGLLSVLLISALRVWEIALDFGGDIFAVGEARAALAVGASSVLAAAAYLKRARIPAFSAAVALFASQSLHSGHHLDLKGTILPFATAAHGLHLAAVLVWSTAVAALLLRRDEAQARQTRRLSTYSVAVLAFAGPTLTYSLARPVDLTSTWSLLMLIKAVLLVAVAVLAWRNHRDTGSFNSTPHDWGRSVRAEVMLFVGVAALSAVLTTATPPVMASEVERISPPPAAVGAMAEQFDREPRTSLESEILFNGGASATLSHDSATGRWVLEMSEPIGASRMDLVAENPSAGVGGFSVPLLGDGAIFTGEGSLPLPGSWQVELTFLADRFDLQTATTTLEIGEMP